MSDNNELKNKAFNGMLWSFAQKLSSQGLAFGISVVLARILSPDDYGTVALAGMFIVLCGVFGDGGLGQALIRQKDVDERDLNTMFVSQLVFSSFIYLIIFVGAPYFAALYDKPILTDIIRVSALTMPLGALAGVQNSVVTRRLMFKWYFYTNLASLVASGSVGLYMAYAGYGVWALVAQGLISPIVSTIVIWCLLDWHPKFQFDYNRFKPLFSKGIQFCLSSLIGTANYQLKGYLLGWKYSSSDLAYYNRGEGLPDLVTRNIDGTIQGVLFPAIAQIQDDLDAVRNALRRAIKSSIVILFPMLFGLAAISDKLVIILFSEKWAPAIPFMRINCFGCAIAVLCAVNIQPLKAIGHIALINKLDMIKKPLAILAILITVQISPIAIVYACVIVTIISYFINAWPNKKIIKYSYWQQMIDVAPVFFLSSIMAIIVYFVGFLIKNIYASIVLQIIVGFSFYIGIMEIVKIESYMYVKALILAKFRKNR